MVLKKSITENINKERKNTMKKTIVALALCLALLSALLFTSCEYLPDGLRDMLPPGSAEAVYERVDEAMSASGSYKMDGKKQDDGLYRRGQVRAGCKY